MGGPAAVRPISGQSQAYKFDLFLFLFLLVQVRSDFTIFFSSSSW